MDDLDIAEHTFCKERNSFGCQKEFSDVFPMLMDDNDLNMPSNIEQAERLFLNILFLVQDVL
jgi:hypothetical protein